ncbi:alanine aminotransferase 2-like isoform X2 [Ambystoma mexicanum]
MGQKPMTFIRQVCAICAYPELLNSASLPEDAKQRARDILKNVAGGTIGAYNVEYSVFDLPEKMAKYIERRDGGIPSRASNVIISVGASRAILSALSMVIVEEEGKKTGVMISTPRWPGYMDAIKWIGAVEVEYYLNEENGWTPNMQEIRRALYEARTHCNPKVLCIENPGNPTGCVQNRECIEEVIRLAAEENLLLFADEVYQDTVFAPGCYFHSFKKVLFEMGPEYSENVQLISIHSISKGHTAEAGMRCGYLEFVNIEEAVLECLHLSAFFGHPPVLGMIVMGLMLDPPMPGEPSYDNFMAEKQETLNNLAVKARLTEEMLNQAPGIHCNPIQGAIHAFPRIEIPDKAVKVAQAQGLEPDVFFCRKLLDETGIILVPGSAFGQLPGTHHFRLPFLDPVEKLKTILTSIKDYHRKFQQEYS